MRVADLASEWWWYLSGLATLLGSKSALAAAGLFRKDRFVGHELLAKKGSTTQRTVLTASGRSRRRVGALGRSSLVGGLDFVPRNLGVFDGIGSRSCIVTGRESKINRCVCTRWSEDVSTYEQGRQLLRDQRSGARPRRREERRSICCGAAS